MSLIEDILQDLPAPAGNVNKPDFRAYLAARENISVMDPAFGAVGDGVADDSAAIQAAFDYQATLHVNEAGAGVGGGRGFVPAVYFPAGTYLISETVTLSSGYATLVGDNARIVKAGSFTGTAALEGNGWRTTVIGLQFEGFARAIDFDTTNIDSGRTIIQRCGFFGITDTAIVFVGPSSYVLIEDCMFMTCKHETDITADLCFHHGGWIFRGLLTDDYDGGIINRANMHIENVVGVPITQSIVEAAWAVNLGTQLRMVRCRLGGEAGSHTAINHKGSSAFGGGGTHESSVIDGNVHCAADDKTVIRLFTLPNVLKVTGNVGMEGAKAINWSSFYDTTGQNAFIAGIPAGGARVNQLYIDVHGNSVQNPAAGNMVPTNLYPWVDSLDITFIPTYTTSDVDFDAVTYDATTAVQGRASKRGRQVTVNLWIQTDSITVGSATGTVRIGGLPFTVASNGAGTDNSRSVAFVSGAAGFAGDVPIGGYTIPGTETIQLTYRTASNAADQDLAIADLATGANANTLYLSCTYTMQS